MTRFELPQPIPDGRQSEIALAIARGVRRMLRGRGYSSVTELPLLDRRRADVVALHGDGSLLIVEIKSSIADFRADRKWRDYAAHCDRFYFAIPPEVPAAIMPVEAGLILADSYGAEIVREPDPNRLAAATRRAVMLRFAQAAADRLHRLADPGRSPRGGWVVSKRRRSDRPARRGLDRISPATPKVRKTLLPLLRGEGFFALLRLPDFRLTD
jgi:hypothetical protein